MKDEMCNFYTMFYYDSQDQNSEPEEACETVNEKSLDFPADSDQPLPDDGNNMKMDMKRSEQGKQMHFIPKDGGQIDTIRSCFFLLNLIKGNLECVKTINPTEFQNCIPEKAENERCNLTFHCIFKLFSNTSNPHPFGQKSLSANI